MKKLRKRQTYTTNETSSHNQKRLRDILSILKTYHLTKGITPSKLRSLLEDLGPTYVKLGQIMSMRSDMIPDIYCQELTKLRTNVKPISFCEIKTILEREWGCPIEEILEEIQEEPIGSASIAQVHYARLKAGKEVVLKIQRPHIKEIMQEDIRLLKKAIQLLPITLVTGDSIDLLTILDELWRISQEEMDFLKEAHNLSRFYENQKEIVYITSPKVFYEHTTSKVLVMDYINGIQIDQLEQLEHCGYDLIEIGRKSAENYCKQILEDGFFHADPHPGNLWISDGQIAWLDLGMTGTLSEYHKQLLKKAIIALLKNDIYELKNVFLAFGDIKESIDHARLYNDINDIVQRYMSIGFGNIDLGKLMERFLSLLKVHKIALHADLTILCRSMVTMEGTLRICSPSVNMMEILSLHMSQQFLTSDSLHQELRHKLRLFYSSIDKTLEIPALFSDLLNITKNGQTRLNLNIDNETFSRTFIQRQMRHLILCFLIGFFFIGSSILCLSSLTPTIFYMPWISFIGFVICLILFLLLLFDLFARKK